MTRYQKQVKQPTLPLFEKESTRSRGSWLKQIRLLEKCVASGTDLNLVLQTKGLSYEDLRYQFDEKLKNTSNKYRRLEDFKVKPHGFPVVSFFSGAGGLDLGFEAAGFEHAACIEINKLFCDTLKVNRPKWRIIGPPEHSGNVSEVESLAEEIHRVLGSRKPFEGVFIGGPPCQPFSIAANQRFNKSGKKFKRVGYNHETYGNLLFEFISLVKLFRPAAFMIENVPGLLDVDKGEQLKEAIRILNSAGYSVEEPMVVDAAHFQVPQHRLRLFIVGTRRKGHYRLPTISSQLVPSSAVFTMPINGAKNHETRKHKAESILRYMKLLYGEREKIGRVDRLNPHRPSKTVIAGGSGGGGRSHLHPQIPRTISVREGARLQTFPDNYEFTGPSARQFTQIGNAVPPVLAAQLALSLKKSFFY